MEHFVIMAKESLCGKCTGLCCRYFALPIETPTDKGDYDDIRWYLCHKDITVFVDEGDWYINIKNECRYLDEYDYTCRMYNKRPRICRSYTMKDCDLAEGEYDYEIHFTSDKQMEEYMKRKFGNNKTEKQESQKKKRKKKK